MTTHWLGSPWRDLATGQLLREVEARRWDLADLDAHPEGWSFAEESRQFLVSAIRDINAELSRRRNLVGRPGAPAWPAQPPDPKGELDEIKRRVPIIDLINSEVFRVYERRRAHDVWCCCPLPDHDEQTPSFHIDEERQVWKCFGCQRGGDLFVLAQHLWGEGLFYKVADRLRELAGMERPAPAGPTPPSAMNSVGKSVPLRITRPRQRFYGRG